MNEIEIAVGALAAVALPLVGIGPMLLRTLPKPLVAVALLLCAAVVWVLTHAPWATAFTLCLGVAVLWRGRSRGRAGHAGEAPVPGFVAPRADSEADPA